MYHLYRLLLIVFLMLSNAVLSQTDSVQIDCDDFDAQLERAFANKSSSYDTYEMLVINTLSNGNKKKLSRNQLVQVLSTSEQVEYDFEVEMLIRGNNKIFKSYYRDEFNPIFELTQYESDYRVPFSLWRISWDYFKHHTIDVKTYATIIADFAKEDFLDMSLACNQKAFVLMLGKILGDQNKSADRIDFYEKSEPILTDFFKSAGVDLKGFEKDFVNYLHSYELTDSTIENQYLAYHFYTSDLEFMPLPQSEAMRNKFRDYHKKLFTQKAFFIDTTKIVKRPESWDSLSLLKDIMRAFPDSIMFAPGQTPFELKMEQLIEQEDKEDKWYLTIYAGVFKYSGHELHDNIVRYSPIDFRSSAFRKWYALFVLQQMFNSENIEPGVMQLENSYRTTADYNNKIDNYFTLFLFNSKSHNTRIVKPYYPNSGIQTFNKSNYHLEIFDNALFKDDQRGFRIQLKLNPDGSFTRKESFIEPPMSAAREKLLFDALSKYKFNPFLVKYPDSTGYGWIQITCKQRTESEHGSEWDIWGDVDMILEEIPDDIEPDMPVEEEEIFSFPQQDPLFIHGEEGLEKFIKSRIPADRESKEKGTVYVRAIVNKDGSLERIRIVKGINDELDNIAKDIVRAMPNWIPGENDNTPVRAYTTILIVFD